MLNKTRLLLESGKDLNSICAKKTLDERGIIFIRLIENYSFIQEIYPNFHNIRLTIKDKIIGRYEHLTYSLPSKGLEIVHANYSRSINWIETP